jgi:hypothetical protein
VLEYVPECVFPFVRIGSPASECVPPLEPNGGGEATLALDEGAGGGPMRTTGEKAWHSVFSVGSLNNDPELLYIVQRVHPLHCIAVAGWLKR